MWSANADQTRRSSIAAASRYLRSNRKLWGARRAQFGNGLGVLPEQIREGGTEAFGGDDSSDQRRARQYRCDDQERGQWRALQGDAENRAVTRTDMFGGATSPSSDSIVGLAAKMPSPCRGCGSVSAVIESTGTGPHHGSLRCQCGQFRGWVSKQTYNFVTATIREFGRPTQPIEIRRSTNGE
jgi:hypothetical protein